MSILLIYYSKKLAEILLEQTGIYKYSIKFEDKKQLFYELINKLTTIKLKIIKIYIKIN